MKRSGEVKSLICVGRSQTCVRDGAEFADALWSLGRIERTRQVVQSKAGWHHKLGT